MEKSSIPENILNERESAILRTIIYEYISTGTPVGSRSFVQKYSFSISPATMRNIMYDLEAMGFLIRPHTSAGRVPTDKGYRYYVDQLLDSYVQIEDNKTQVKEIFREELIRRELHLDKLFLAVTKMLSLASKYAGVVLTPNLDYTIVKHIELISLDNNEVLFVLVTRTGMVYNKRVTISAKVTQDELYNNSKYLTGELCGYSMFEIKEEIFQKLRSNSMITTNEEVALDIAELALSKSDAPELLIDGIENLLHIPEMVENERLKSLLHLIEEKKILREIMERSLYMDGVTTLIGDEIAGDDISGCSIVTSAYKIGNKNAGVVGVIGPTRMDYEKVVPLVGYAENRVSAFLTNISR